MLDDLAVARLRVEAERCVTHHGLCACGRLALLGVLNDLWGAVPQTTERPALVARDAYQRGLIWLGVAGGRGRHDGDRR